MTGVERLEGISMAFRGYTWGASLSEALGDIAGQIKREHAEDCFRMGERAAEGKVGPKTRHEMALSLLDDWEREAVERERARRLGIAADVSVSAYDLLPADEREAIAWVRERGGLDAVKVTENVRLNYRDALNGVCKRLGLTDGSGMPDMPEVIWAELDRRLMPEGMEEMIELYPRYEDGTPALPGMEAVANSGRKSGETFTIRKAWLENGTWHLSDHVADGHYWHWKHKDRVVKRPAPKMLDADGVEICEGDTVWHVRGGFGPRFVSKFETHDGRPVAVFEPNGTDLRGCECDQLTHRAPVLAADGKPLRVGETVWHKSGFAHGVVESIDAGSLMHTTRYRDESGAEYRDAAKDLTHERPAPKDDWKSLFDWVRRPGIHTDEDFAEFERRARALAGDA